MDIDKDESTEQSLTSLLSENRPLVQNLIINNNSEIRTATLEKEVLRILQEAMRREYRDSNL